MAFFNLESEFNKALKMDGPITRGPAMRWQRKLNDSSNANRSNLTGNGSLLQMNCSTAKSPSRITSGNRSLSLSNIASKDSGNGKHTPPRRSRTPG